MCRAEVPVGPIAIGQWADRKPENALRTLFSPFSISVSVTPSLFLYLLYDFYILSYAYIVYNIYVNGWWWWGRKYLISAKSRKSQHRAFCVIKPRPQKLYGLQNVCFHPARPLCRVMVPLGNANRNATHKAKNRLYTYQYTTYVYNIQYIHHVLTVYILCTCGRYFFST